MMNRRWIILSLLVLIGCAARETPDQQVLRIAQSSLPASTRVAQGLPYGSWRVQFQGDRLMVVLPLNFDTTVQHTQTVAQPQLSAAVQRLFEAFPDRQGITVMGTLPALDTGVEYRVLAVDVTREQYQTWDGDPAHLGIWERTVPQ